MEDCTKMSFQEDLTLRFQLFKDLREERGSRTTLPNMNSRGNRRVLRSLFQS